MHQSGWEIAFWAGLVVVGGVIVATASTPGEAAGGVAFLVVLVAIFIWSGRLRAKRPELFAFRVPVEILWLLGAIGVFVASGVFTSDSTAEKIIDGLLAVSLVMFIVAERTRDLPEAEMSSGPGYFFAPSSTRTDLARRRRTVELLWLAAVLALVAVLVIFEARLAVFGLLVAPFFLVSFELVHWLAKKKTLGYPEIQDDPNPPR